LKRVGSYVVEAGEKFINVSPADIAGFYDFVPVDGTLPVDRMAQANLWKELMGNIRMMPPEIAMGYDWSRIFAWVAQLGGLKNITQFKIQLTPQEQLLRMAQQGNVVPMKPPPGRGSPVEAGNAASTQTGNNALQGGSSIDGTQY
jgi:hypothetical protein